MIFIKRFKHIVICCMLALAALFLFLFPEISVAAIGKGLSVCANSILPALFPFFILSNLWFSLGYAQKLSQILGPCMIKCFHLPGNAASALLMGAIGGYPVGAQTAAQLCLQKCLSKQDAEAVLFFCNNAGPAFIFGIIGGKLFQSAAIGAVLWEIHLFSALILGFLFRPSASFNSTADFKTNETPSFLPALTEAVTSAGQTAFQVCLYILFFSVVSEYLSAFLPSNPTTSVLLGTLELASGCVRLGSLNLRQETVFVLCAGLVGWGGLCVHCQTVSILHKANLSSVRYLLGKALQAIISTAIACLVAPLLSLQAPCFAAPADPPIGAIGLLACLLILLFLKSSSGKMINNRI